MAQIKLSLEEINGIITKINASREEIAVSWNSIKIEDVAGIRATWAGDDCEAYINKVMEMDDQMQKAISALALLANTYTKARDKVLETQQNVATSVSGI